jgi:FkbM family methyltransferase
MPHPQQIFGSPVYRDLNRTRLDHLHSMGVVPEPLHRVLELGAGIGDLSGYFVNHAQHMVIVEGREKNVQILRQRYSSKNIPHVRVVRMDLNTPSDLREEPFDLVLCYGLLYHLRNPLAFLDWAAAQCRGVLVLETRVSNGLGPGLHFVAERSEIPDRAMDGVGIRPDRHWLLCEMTRRFKHVYLPIVPPKHPEFPRDWSNIRLDAQTMRHKTATPRSIMVCSNTALDSPHLTPFSPGEFQFSEHMHLVQIGAYHGDSVQPQDERVLLVEPDSRAYLKLQELFGRRPGFFLENVAVASATGMRTFHSLSDTTGLPEWCARIGSLKPEHIPALGVRNKMERDFAPRMQSEEVLCLHVAELLNAYGTRRIDRLVVDTEGMDYDILTALPLNEIDIPTIVFERKHMDGPLTTGTRYLTLLNRLADHGYQVRALDKENDVAVRQVECPVCRG